MSLSISEVCEHIPYFSGNTEDLDIFIERCELAQSIVGPSTEFVLVQFIKQKLIGIAADALYEKNINSVHEIIKLLEIYFGDGKSTYELFGDLSLIKQKEKESVREFANKIEKIGTKIRKVAARENRYEVMQFLDKDLLEYFLRGLKWEVRERIFKTVTLQNTIIEHYKRLQLKRN